MFFIIYTLLINGLGEQVFYDNEYPVLSLKLVNLAQKPLEESFFFSLKRWLQNTVEERPFSM